MRELSIPELLKEAGHKTVETGQATDPETQALLVGIGKAIADNDAEGVILFRNDAFDSSRFGESSFVVFGPTCTYRSPEEAEGKWLNDLPSQRQYAVAFARKS